MGVQHSAPGLGWGAPSPFTLHTFPGLLGASTGSLFKSVTHPGFLGAATGFPSPSAFLSLEPSSLPGKVLPSCSHQPQPLPSTTCSKPHRAWLGAASSGRDRQGRE